MSCFVYHEEYFILRVRLIPNASKTSIQGIYQDSNGVQMLKISITAIAEDNKANKALIEFLAKQFKVAKSCFSIIQGHTHRNKVLRINTLDSALMSLVTARIEQLGSNNSFHH